MILLIDVGNSQISMGVHDGKKIIKTFSMETHKIKTKDEFALYLVQLLSLNGIEKEGIHGVSISSVVPKIDRFLKEGCMIALGIGPFFIAPGIKTGIKIRTENPKEVGSDLIVDAVAAYVKYGGDIIIINSGTATKASMINSGGEFLGVAIGPGYETGSASLFRSTATLPDVGFQLPKDVLGKNSVLSLSSGLYYGYIGSVRYLIQRIKLEYGAHLKTVLTGGITSYIKGGLEDVMDYVAPNLTLEGLKIIYDKNKD